MGTSPELLINQDSVKRNNKKNPRRRAGLMIQRKYSQLQHLHSNRRSCRASTVDQDMSRFRQSLARQWQTEQPQSNTSRADADGQRGRSLGTPGVGNLGPHPAAGDGVLAEGATLGRGPEHLVLRPKDSVADDHAGDVSSRGHHHPGEVGPQDAELGREGASHLGVARVEADRLDPHHDLVRRELGAWCFVPDDDLVFVVDDDGPLGRRRYEFIWQSTHGDFFSATLEYR